MADHTTASSTGVVGVTAGKFNPPHLGHQLLINHAAQHCGVLHVLICDRPDQTLPAATRRSWLADTAPDNVVFHITPDDLPDEDSKAWADRTRNVLGQTPDVVFTSEEYGDSWAHHLGCSHQPVDPPRQHHPICATDVRANLTGNFNMLVPAARAALTRRVVLVGAESTGKSTLARKLAAKFGTCWVPEWARTYDAGKQTSPAYGWTADEFNLIVRQQRQLEDALARQAGPWLFCDTDALATAVWHRRYVGRRSEELEQAAAERRPDLYLLLRPDLPWDDDGTRESAHMRRRMHEWFLEMLQTSQVPWTEIGGHGDSRLQAACEAISRHTEDLPELT